MKAESVENVAISSWLIICYIMVYVICYAQIKASEQANECAFFVLIILIVGHKSCDIHQAVIKEDMVRFLIYSINFFSSSLEY